MFLEAWCYGVPVIGAQAGGIPDVISAEQDGLLVRYGDPDELANALARLLADPELRRRMGQAGREKVYQHLTWDRVVDR